MIAPLPIPFVRLHILGLSATRVYITFATSFLFVGVLCSQQISPELPLVHRIDSEFIASIAGINDSHNLLVNGGSGEVYLLDPASGKKVSKATTSKHFFNLKVCPNGKCWAGIAVVIKRPEKSEGTTLHHEIFTGSIDNHRALAPPIALDSLRGTSLSNGMSFSAEGKYLAVWECDLTRWEYVVYEVSRGKSPPIWRNVSSSADLYQLDFFLTEAPRLNQVVFLDNSRFVFTSHADKRFTTLTCIDLTNPQKAVWEAKVPGLVRGITGGLKDGIVCAAEDRDLTSAFIYNIDASKGVVTQLYRNGAIRSLAPNSIDGSGLFTVFLTDRRDQIVSTKKSNIVRRFPVSDKNYIVSLGIVENTTGFRMVASPSLRSPREWNVGLSISAIRGEIAWLDRESESLIVANTSMRSRSEFIERKYQVANIKNWSGLRGADTGLTNGFLDVLYTGKNHEFLVVTGLLMHSSPESATLDGQSINWPGFRIYRLPFE